MSGDTQSRHCWWLMLAVSLAHNKLLSTTKMRGRTWKPVAPGTRLNDLQSKDENVFRPDEQPSGVTAVGPDQPDGGEAAAQCGQESGCGVAVLDRAAVTTTPSSCGM